MMSSFELIHIKVLENEKIEIFPGNPRVILHFLGTTPHLQSVTLEKYNFWPV